MASASAVNSSQSNSGGQSPLSNIQSPNSEKDSDFLSEGEEVIFFSEAPVDLPSLQETSLPNPPSVLTAQTSHPLPQPSPSPYLSFPPLPYLPSHQKHTKSCPSTSKSDSEILPPSLKPPYTLHRYTSLPSVLALNSLSPSTHSPNINTLTSSSLTLAAPTFNPNPNPIPASTPPSQPHSDLNPISPLPDPHCTTYKIKTPSSPTPPHLPIPASHCPPLHYGNIAGLLTFPGFGLEVSSHSLDPSGSSSTSDSNSSSSHLPDKDSSDLEYVPDGSHSTHPSHSHQSDSYSSSADPSSSASIQPLIPPTSPASAAPPDFPIIFSDPSTPSHSASPPTPPKPPPLSSPPPSGPLDPTPPSAPSSKQHTQPKKSKTPKRSPIVTRRSSRPSKGSRRFF